MQNEELKNSSEEKEIQNESETQHQEESTVENTTESTSSENEENSELEVLQNNFNELNDKYIRLVAEFDNFRKRNAKERIDLIRTASEDVIKSLLEVLDDSDRALVQLETAESIEEIKAGIQLIFQKLKNTLISKGLEEMNAKNQEFNPDLHEAITEIPAPSEDMKGKVIDEVIKGYILNEKIIRYAKVVVGK